jgi:ABC-type multidrug transport system ATPase subunit
MSDFQKVTTSDIEMGKVNVSKAATTARPATPGNRSLRFSEAGLSEATIVWKNLDKFVEIDNGKSKKQILFNVGGVAKPGDLIALMGPSGSGKTTLLNVLGGRALANLTGEVLINNVKYKKSMRRTIAYVLQEDIFYTNLTVRQQLYFTSNLRLPDALSAETKRAVVEQVIKTLRIEKCADTQILMISGGEKKRCNIGTELLTNPSILLLDEPTSGLDSTAANSLVKTLRELATDRMTIITSIHQPSSQVSIRSVFLLFTEHIEPVV